MLMFLDLFIIFGVGSLIFILSRKIKIPALIFYLLLGILINSLGLIDSNLSAISPYLRKIALIIILIKAGLSLDLNDLKKVGRPAILMSFMPAVIEMVTIGLVAPLFFNISYVESFLLGSVIGAVSPAVVIPMMTKLIDKKKGTNKGVPQLILAGSSIDDIVMIVFFQAFMSIEKGGEISWFSFANIFVSVFTGIAIGIVFGLLISLIFKKVNLTNILKIIIIISLGLGFAALEEVLLPYFGFSSLLATITLCLVVRLKDKITATEVAKSAGQIWIPSEMVLFFLVGSVIKIEYALKYIGPALLILLISLSARTLAVNGCLLKTKLNWKERLFTVIAYLPKATVQASIGGILLDYGNTLLSQGSSRADAIIAAGTIVLSISVLSILITAPVSSICMNLTYDKLLESNSD